MVHTKESDQVLNYIPKGKHKENEKKKDALGSQAADATSHWCRWCKLSEW